MVKESLAQHRAVRDRKSRKNRVSSKKKGEPGLTANYEMKRKNCKK